MGKVPRWQEKAHVLGWRKMEPAQVEEGHDVAERMHWDTCGRVKTAELQ
jgi:hypothetical protein